MSSILPYALALAMAVTAMVLFTGVVTFALNTKVNAKYSTRLMAMRVIAQGVAIALLAVVVLLRGH